MNKQELSDWYVANVGYCPFSDDPNITESEVRQTIAEYQRAKSEAITMQLELEYEAYLAANPDVPQTDAESAYFALIGNPAMKRHSDWLLDFIRRWEREHA